MAMAFWSANFLQNGGKYDTLLHSSDRALAPETPSKTSIYETMTVL